MATDKKDSGYTRGFLIAKSSPGWIVWNGYHSPGRYESCFLHDNILASGTTREAAEAAMRLLEVT